MSIANFEDFELPADSINNQLANIALNNIDEGVMITNSHNQIIYVNKKFEKITGFTFAEVKGKTPRNLQSGIQELSFYENMKQVVIQTGKWQGELWNRTKSGEVYLQSLSIIAIKNDQDEIENVIGIFSDLLHNDSLENEYLQNITYYDSLTNLPNRFWFEKRVVSVLQSSHDKAFAIIYLQLDNFTEINEKHGFLFGDVLLKRIAKRLQNSIPKNSMVTRWSGTEFTWIIENIANEDKIKNLIKEIFDKIAARILVNGTEISLDASFGVSVYPRDGNTVSSLLSKANRAMTSARKNRTVMDFYKPEMGTPNNFFIMELELKKAIKENQFELYYQPLISVETNKLVGFEALIRWNHPTEGLISPVKFIPLAEQTGLIIEIGNLVFKLACEQLSEWKKQGLTNIKISINLSMNQFKDKYLVENISEIIRKTGVSASDIGIELTESSLIDNMEETILKLHQLKELGFYIAVDDFGTGYSSLGYLIDFPINRIKIDRSFIKVMGHNQKIKAIVSAINTMAKTMDIEVVAEGIETNEQLQIVQKLDCQIVQGYLFDKPLPVEEVEQKWLKI